jgi:hypothetical protein
MSRACCQLAGLVGVTQVEVGVGEAVQGTGLVGRLAKGAGDGQGGFVVSDGQLGMAGAAPASVYNVHIPAQYVADDNPLTGDFYSQLRDRASERKREFDALRADIAANPNAVLVSGDFNSTGAMGELRWLHRHLRGANHAARQLFPTSWPAGGGLALWPHPGTAHLHGRHQP